MLPESEERFRNRAMTDCARGEGRSQEPQSHDIALRQSAEQRTVFTTELRSIFIAHTHGGGPGVKVPVQHQLRSNPLKTSTPYESESTETWSYPKPRLVPK